MSEPCIMEEKINKAIDDIRSKVKWAGGIFAGFILFLIISVVTFGGTAVNNKADIKKINDNYAPLEVLQDISHDNMNLIKVLQMLPNTTKDDPRYINIMNETFQFRSEALRRASSTKRGNK